MRRKTIVGTAILIASLMLAACGAAEDPGAEDPGAEDPGAEDPGAEVSAGESSQSSQAQPDESQMPDETADDETADDETDDDETDDDETDDDETDDEAVAQPRSGEFEGLVGKTVTGSVEVSATEIVLSEFSSDEAPDLHVYLANGSDLADVTAGVEIDVVAFDEASQTFTLDGVDVADYDTVVIHCVKAKAVYGAAPLA